MERKVFTDRETVLMGYDALIAGGIRREPLGDGCKYMPVYDWNSTEDRIEWQICCEKEGWYLFTCLIEGYEAKVSLYVDEEKLVFGVDGTWDRVDAGKVYLTRGSHSILLRAVDPGKNLSLYSVELISEENKEKKEKEAAELRSSTDWMRKAKYGVQFHWTTHSCPREGRRKSYEEAVDQFPVEAFAASVADMGAGYVIMTTSHAEHYVQAPIAAVDRVLPGRTTKRDLIGDIIQALDKYNIRLMLYYHMGHDDCKNPNGWWYHTGYEKDRELFLQNWKSIVSEMGERYGKGLAGWFFDDGCVYYPLNPDFADLTRAAKKGNPDRIVCYNPWIFPRMTDYQDYFCGEGYDFLLTRKYLQENGDGIFVDGPQKGLQAHTNFILEEGWVHGQENTPIGAPAVDLDKFVADMQEAIRFGIVPSVNLEIYQEGTVSPQSEEYMKEIKKRIK